MADIKAFRREQERIYRERFRHQEAMIRREGFKPDPIVTGERGGVLVAFLPDLEARWRMRDILDLLGRCITTCDVSHIRYATTPFRHHRATVHSTISDCEVADHFVPSLDMVTNRFIDMLRFNVAKTVRSLPMTTRKRCVIRFNKPLLCNSTTVIAPGEPSEEWLIVVDRIIRRCRSAGIDLRDPWGAHMTLARFTETTEPWRAKQLLPLVHEIRPRVSFQPRSIGVGTFTFNVRDGFQANWLHRIRLY